MLRLSLQVYDEIVLSVQQRAAGRIDFQSICVYMPGVFKLTPPNPPCSSIGTLGSEKLLPFR